MTPSAKKSCLSISLLTIFFALSIASVSKKMTYKNVENSLPENFDPAKTTLLIEKHPLTKKQNARMIKFLEDHYPYSYEVLDREVIEAKTGQYADKDKYPFALMWESSTSSRTTMRGGKFETSRAWDMYGYFLDRSTGKQYPPIGKGNNLGQVGYRPVINSLTNRD